MHEKGCVANGWSTITMVKAGAVACVLALALGWPGITLRADQYTSYDSRAVDLYPIREIWGPVHSTSPNVSHFIFRDLARNGSWDVGDRPMPGIAVKLLAPDGTHTLRRSNIHGFVNFSNSLTASPVDVSAPGEYVFEVIIPPGWELTSDNSIQAGVYEKAPLSRPGIVVDQVPQPAGLAPIIVVEGRVETTPRSSSARTIRVEALNPAGEALSLQLDLDGWFSFPAQPGPWQVRVHDAERAVWAVRDISIVGTPVRMSTIRLADRRMPRGSSRRVVDFEEITASPITKVPNGYAGLRWTNLVAVKNELYGGAGYINNTVSGTYVSYNTSGYPVVIAADEPFDFIGGYFGAAWPTAEGEVLEIRAWHEQEVIADETLVLSALGPVWFDADFRGITRIELSTRHYWQFVADDLEFAFR